MKSLKPLILIFSLTFAITACEKEEFDQVNELLTSVSLQESSSEGICHAMPTKVKVTGYYKTYLSSPYGDHSNEQITNYSTDPSTGLPVESCGAFSFTVRQGVLDGNKFVPDAANTSIGYVDQNCNVVFQATPLTGHIAGTNLVRALQVSANYLKYNGVEIKNRFGGSSSYVCD